MHSDRSIPGRPRPAFAPSGDFASAARWAAAFAVALLAAAPAAQTAAPAREGSPEKLGTVDFPISCSAAAQVQFTRAVALKHSYHWVEARKGFQSVLAADPGCAMGH